MPGTDSMILASGWAGKASRVRASSASALVQFQQRRGELRDDARGEVLAGDGGVLGIGGRSGEGRDRRAATDLAGLSQLVRRERPRVPIAAGVCQAARAPRGGRAANPPEPPMTINA